MAERGHERLRAALDEWSSYTLGAAPRAGATLEIRAAQDFAVTQVRLATAYESRRVSWRYERVLDARVPTPQAAIDPWAFPVDAPRDGRAFAKTQPLDEFRAVVVCHACSGRGIGPCQSCQGSGALSVGSGNGAYYPCDACGESGEGPCVLCLRTVLLHARPSLEVECGTVVRTRVLAPQELPLELLFALQERRDPAGARVLEESGEALAPRVLAAGGPFRSEAARVSAEVNAAVDELLAIAPTEGSARVYKQDLGVYAVPVWRVEHGRARELWVYGAPAAVWPRGVLRRRGWMARLFGGG